jgi:hypothetical protein
VDELTARRPARPLPNRLLAIGGAVAAAILAVIWLRILYLGAQLWLPNSDVASGLLAGADFLDGNFLLRGWELPRDSFWLTQIPIDAGVIALKGIGPQAAFLVGTSIWGALTACALLLASWRRPGLAAAIAAVATFCLLSDPGPGMLAVQHISTALFGLAAIGAMLLTAIGKSPLWALVGAAVLGIGSASDPLVAVFAAAPLTLVSLLAAVIAHPRGRWLWIAMLSAVGSAGGLAIARAAQHFGGLRSFGVPGALKLRPDALSTTAGAIAQLLGVGDPLLLALRSLIVVGALAGIVIVVRARGPRLTASPEQWLMIVLASGALANVAGFAVYAFEPTAGGRRLVPGIVCVAVLTGRLAGSLVAGIPRRAAYVAALTTAVLLAGHLFVVARWTGYPRPVDEGAQVAKFLKGQGLSTGFGAYWTASSVTVASKGKVVVRPIYAYHGALERFPFNQKRQWYAGDTARPKNFVLWDTKTPTYGVEESLAVKTWGSPAKRLTFKHFVVLVWDYELRVTR